MTFGPITCVPCPKRRTLPSVDIGCVRGVYTLTSEQSNVKKLKKLQKNSKNMCIIDISVQVQMTFGPITCVPCPKRRTLPSVDIGCVHFDMLPSPMS